MNDMEQIDDARWDKVLAREPGADFVYAVRTTSIYCRTGCPSRTPARRNVVRVRRRVRRGAARASGPASAALRTTSRRTPTAFG